LTELRSELHGGNLAVQEVHIFDGRRGGKSICEDGIGKQDVAEVFGWQLEESANTESSGAARVLRLPCHISSLRRFRQARLELRRDLSRQR